MKEASKGKVTGWKGQGLSKVDREVLVKSRLQSTPTYPMSCSQLPKKTCRKVTSISSKFWWNSTSGDRKIHYIAWDKMCTTKREGCMGFRNYQVFNQALLAKQAWRILWNPSSLCARVLKARYFKDGSIMNATCPSNVSFTFKSIIHGRDFLREGTIQRIGDGSRINIHHDSWIPRMGSLKPLGEVYVPGITKVSDLLNSHGTNWDRAKVS